jgi:hypothetical protein
MNSSDTQPLVEVIRGPVVESIHYGVIVVADPTRRVVTSIGNPETVTFYVLLQNRFRHYRLSNAAVWSILDSMTRSWRSYAPVITAQMNM